MSVVKKNVAIGLVGRVVSSLSSFIMLPLYLPLMGKDAFGLIALGVATVRLLFMLSVSLRPVVARDIAVRLKAGEPQAPVIRVNEIISVSILIMIAIGYPWLGKLALGKADLGELPIEVALQCFCYLFFAVGFQSFTSSYVGVINGRQQGAVRAFLINGKQIFIAVGGYVALLITKGNPLSYFQNLLAVEIVFAAISACCVWVPIKSEFMSWRIGRKDFASLAKLGSLNIVIGFLIAVTAFVERWMLGQVLSIATIGYYTLLMTPFVVISNISGSIGAVLMPRLAELDLDRDESKKIKLIEKAVWVTNIILVVGFSLVSFRPELMYGIWLRDINLVEKIVPFVSLASLLTFPISHAILQYNYDLASGRLSVKLYANLAKALVVIITGYWALSYYGLRGYMSVIFTANFLIVLCLAVYILNRERPWQERILKSIKWWATAVLIPALFAVFCIPYVSKILSGLGSSIILQLIASIGLTVSYLLTQNSVRKIAREGVIFTQKKFKSLNAKT